MSKSSYITTAIDYANGSPHLGHAYEKVLTDIIARFRRLMGDEVKFLTGLRRARTKSADVTSKQVCLQLKSGIASLQNSSASGTALNISSV